VEKVFLQEHVNLQKCTYNAGKCAKWNRVKGLPRCLTTIPDFGSSLDNHPDECLDLILSYSRIHAGKFQTLAAAYARVTDDGFSPVEEVLAEGGVELIGVDAGGCRDAAEYDGAELWFAHQF
jgi:hypothetical protein